MANEEDECDSSGRFTLASQADVTSFLHSQVAKITGLNSSISDNDDDNDENSIDDHLLARLSDNRSTSTKSYLSRSCFASISSPSAQKSQPFDDLTELKWLSTFKFKEFKENKLQHQDLKEQPSPLVNNTEDYIGKLSNELKTYDHEQHPDSISYGVMIFLALYSKHDDQHTSWSLTMKDIYEYIQTHMKHIVHRRGWKNSLKQTLTSISCFVKTKPDLIKSHSLWTIDPYYRPLLTKAYLTSSSVQMNKTMSTNEKDDLSLNLNRSFESIVNNFPPKATVKTKALPRLYGRLCEEKSNQKDEDKPNSSGIVKHQHNLISGAKRPRSTSSSAYWRTVKDNDKNRLSVSSPWSIKISKRQKTSNHRHQSDTELKASTSTKQSNIITPCPSVDHMYFEREKTSAFFANEPLTDEDDECDSSVLICSRQKSIMTIRTPVLASHSLTKEPVHRRKSSPPKKRSSLLLSSRRANTRISRRIIEEDLQLLRQANLHQQPLDLSIRESSLMIPTTGALDLSVTRA